MFPVFTLVTPVLKAVVEAIVKNLAGDLASEGLRIIKENYLGIETPEKIMESGFKNIEGRLGNIQNSIFRHGQILSNIQIGIAHQTTMLSAIQSSIGALSMTATAGCALSAVNLYQLIKIRKSLDRMEQKIDNGFLDLKLFFSQSLQDLLNEQQRRRLAQAYVYYKKGIEQLQSSVLIEDSVNRKLAISNAISIFTQAFAVYDNKEEYATINAPAKLRRLECCWAIQSSIAEAYCFQSEYLAALDSYKKLRDRIHAETQGLKDEMNPANFRFILNDLHWIYKNDMSLITDKIELLESNSRKPQSVLINIDFSEKAEDSFHGNYLSTAKLYIDCLVSPQKLNDVRNAVLFSNKTDNIRNLVSLQHIDFCRLYTQDIVDSNEYSAAYLEPEKINIKFIRFMEEHFLEKVLSRLECFFNKELTNEPFMYFLLKGHSFLEEILLSLFESFFDKELAHSIEPWIKADSKLIELHKLCDSQNPIYEDIQYFNYAVKSYFASAAHYIRYFSQTKSQEKEGEKQRLAKFSQALGLSDKFSSAFDKALLAYSQKKKPLYLKNHRDKIVNTCLYCRNIKLSPDEKQVLVEYEKTTLLTKEEVEKSRVNSIVYFISKKNELVSRYPISDIDPNNDVLVWDVQDIFSIKREEAKSFIRNCQFGIEQYREAIKTLSKNKQLSNQSKAMLKEIQDANGFSDKFVAKIVSLST